LQSDGQGGYFWLGEIDPMIGGSMIGLARHYSYYEGAKEFSSFSA